MKVLSDEDSRAWIKGRRLKHAGASIGAKRVSAVWPKDATNRAEFASRLAKTTSWSGGAVVLERPVMPRSPALDELCRFREAYGFPTTPEEIRLGVAPGHLLDDDKDENQRNVARLLTIMMDGYLEGMLATKSGRLVAAVGDGILEFYCRDKSISGKLRGLLREFKLETFVCDHP